MTQRAKPSADLLDLAGVQEFISQPLDVAYHPRHTAVHEPFSRSLMTRNSIYDRSPGFYDPERRSPKTNAIVIAIFSALMGGALFYSLDQTLTGMTQRDCNAGVQKACDSLK